MSLRNRSAGRRGRQNACARQTWQGYYLRVLSWSSLHTNVLWSFTKRSVWRKVTFGENLFQTKLLSRLSHKVCCLLSSPVLLRKFTNINRRLRDDWGPDLVCSYNKAATKVDDNKVVSLRWELHSFFRVSSANKKCYVLQSSKAAMLRGCKPGMQLKVFILKFDQGELVYSLHRERYNWSTHLFYTRVKTS